MDVHCSQLARPMVCAGFLSFEGLERLPAGPAADEGTAFGELLERMLLGLDIPKQAKNGVFFDDDMHFYAKPIADEIKEKAQGQIRCEQPIDWRTRSGVWIRGRYDASFDHAGNLYIDDAKYGWGIVEVERCWQLIGYAIGEVLRRQTAFPEIILRIRQPRPHHEDGDCREWRLTYAQLLALKEEIEVRFEEIMAGNRTLQTGSQCKYCPAAREACPAFNRLFYRALEVSTEFTQDQIDEAELARQLDHVHRAVEVIKIKMDSLKELAVSRLANGKIIPGYLTESSYGDRKWKPGISPEAVEVLTGKNIIKKEMLSPAQAEKMGVPKEFVKALVDRHFIGKKLVRKDAGAAADKIFGKGAPSGQR